jgi:phenylacetate-CoA ligase
MMSAYHINQSTLIDYVKELNRYQPRIIQAYPSAIFLLAKLIETSNYSLDIDLKSIVLSSESFSIEQKEFIESVFNCPVFSWYGLSERVATVGTCHVGELHLIEDYGFHEFDEHGVLIATGFHNKVMPIVRYDTGDRFKGVEKEFIPCRCGLPFRRVGKIEGRVGEYLYSDIGTRVSIFNHIPKGVIGLVELQLVQHRHKHVDAIVVHTELFNAASKIRLINNIKEYLGNSTEVKIVETNKIDRTRSGKFRQAICHIME